MLIKVFNQRNRKIENKSPRKFIVKSTYLPFVKIRNNGSVEVAMAFVR
jgi:hypothetical protein